MNTPEHLRPENCYVCGRGEHPTTEHTFVSNLEVDLSIAAQPVSNHSPEREYVNQHRPY